MADTDDSLESMRAVARSWALVFLFGLVTIAIGIVIVFKPGGTARVLAIVLGIWLLVFGVYRVIVAIGESTETAGQRWGTALFGILAFLIGLLVLHHSFETVAIVGFIIGLFWLVGSLIEFFSAFGHDVEARGWRLLAGVVGTIIGILCLVYPGLSLSILAVILGIGIIVYGIVEVVLSLQIRKLGRAT
jgi:uncharacterized membrane protein HdeD (DUF308 family)